MNENEIIDKLEDFQITLSHMAENHARDIERLEMEIMQLRLKVQEDIEERLKSSAALSKEDTEAERNRLEAHSA